MHPQQESFDTFGSWLTTRLRADMAPCQGDGSSVLCQFFSSLYEDMLNHPEAYNIPVEPFVTFITPGLLTPEESAQLEALKAARMRVRKAVYAYLDFLYALGKAGSPLNPPHNGDLQLPQAVYDQLVTETAKKAKSRNFISAFARRGFLFTYEDPVIVSNSQYPQLPADLASFSQACARVKDFDTYLFRRCDLAVLDGKTGPAFSDALRRVPNAFQEFVAETQERLKGLRFKCEIFIDPDTTYRLRYSKKGDQIVYWCRIQESFNTDLDHYLRWRLDFEVTPRLFHRLDEITPGLGSHVFEGLKTCLHCIAGNCGDRVIVEWGGKSKEACKGSGWNKIGYAHADYERLWLVIKTLDELI